MNRAVTFGTVFGIQPEVFIVLAHLLQTNCVLAASTTCRQVSSVILRHVYPLNRERSTQTVSGRFLTRTSPERSSDLTIILFTFWLGLLLARTVCPSQIELDRDICIVVELLPNIS